MSRASKNGVYIAPGILYFPCNKNGNNNCLYHLKYRIEDGNKEIAILADSDNLSPEMIKWCIAHRNTLIKKPTKAEKEFQLFVREFTRIKFIFQKTFVICNHVYFADCYLPTYKTIIEIDGKYHDTESQILKDKERTIFLNSIGIKILRITNEEAVDHMRVASLLYRILYRSDESSVSLKSR